MGIGKHERIFMKHLKFLFLVLIGLTLSTTVSSCKDDDKDPSSDVLAGTSWKVLTDSAGDFQGLTITFNKNGTITTDASEDDWGYFGYSKWTLKGNTLKIVLGDDGPDDYLEGKFVISGNNATYNYSYYDYYGTWGGEDDYVMTLTRQ